MGPRRHHYEFAHVVFRSIALRHAAALVAAPLAPLAERTAGLWVAVGRRLPEEVRLPATGLALAHVEVGGATSLLVTLPPALYPPEAHFALVLGPGTAEGVPRYCVLEESLDVVDGTRGTVLGGWSEDTHLNLGPGPDVDPDAFVTAVRARLA
jgi:hypothetical protein